MIDLQQVLQDFPYALSDHKIMKSLLSDLYPLERKRDIYILVSFMECGIVDNIQSSNQNISITDKKYFLNKIENEYGFSQSLCEPILQLWIDALKKQDLETPHPLPQKTNIYNEICAIILTVIEMEMKNDIHGITSISSAIRGADTQKTRDYHLEKLENFGILSDIRADYSQEIINYALNKRWLEHKICQDGYHRIIATSEGTELLTKNTVIFFDSLCKHFKNNNHNNLSYIQQREEKLSEIISAERRRYQSYIDNTFLPSLSNTENNTKSGSVSNNTISAESIKLNTNNDQQDTSITSNQYYQDNSEKNHSCLKWVIGIICYALILTWCLSYNPSSPTKSNTTPTYNRPTNTVIIQSPTPYNSLSFSEHKMSINLGTNYKLNYKPGSSTSDYKIRYDKSKIVIYSKSSTGLIIRGIQEGETEINIIDKEGNIADTCSVTIKNQNKTVFVTYEITPEIQTIQSTPTIQKNWGFEYSNINLSLDESFELHFTRPENTIYTYIIMNAQIIDYKDNGKNSILITGKQPGTTEIKLYNSNNMIMDTCTINIHNIPPITTNQSDPTNTPVPLANKRGGYTEEELRQYGYIPTIVSDGSIKFSGFYQAPNGNYFKPAP